MERSWALDDAEWATEPTKAGRGGGGGRGKAKGKGGSGGKSDAEKERIKNAKDLNKQLDDQEQKLEMLKATYGMSDEQIRIYQASQKALADGATQAIANQVSENEKAIIAQEKLNEAAKQSKAFWSDFASTAVDGISAVIAGTESLSDVLKNLGMILLKYGLTKMLGKWFPGIEIGKNANGTAGWKGGLSWVGERGPELVDLNAGAKVYNNAASMKMLASASNNSNQKVPLFAVDSGVQVQWLSQAEAQSKQITASGIKQYSRNGVQADIKKFRNDPRASGY